MDTAAPPVTAGPTWQQRVAGGLLLLVGVLNAILGALSLLGDQLRLSTGTAGGLVAAGVVTVVFGAFVWRGSRLAAVVALTAFGLLLVVQLGEIASGGAATADELGQQPALRLVVLLLMVATLALAVRRSGRRR